MCRLFCKIYYYYYPFATFSGAKGFLLSLHLKSTPGEFKKPLGILAIEHAMAICKTSFLICCLFGPNKI